MSSSSSISTYVYATKYGIHNEAFDIDAVEPDCVLATCSRLKEYGASPIELQDNSYLNRELDAQKKAVLFIPGGNSALLSSDLKGLVSKMQGAVASGWNYGGTCSGGNFACRALKKNEYTFKYPSLGILPFDAELPVYQIQKTNVQGAANRLFVPILASEQFHAVWSEGSKLKFVGSDPSSVVVEAKYAEITGQPTASASGTYGFGKVFISQVHPEFPPIGEEIKLEKSSEPRTKFLHRMFDYLEVPKRSS